MNVQASQEESNVCGKNIYQKMFDSEIEEVCLSSVGYAGDEHFSLDLFFFDRQKVSLSFFNFYKSEYKKNTYIAVARGDIGELFKYEIKVNTFLDDFSLSDVISISGPSPFGPGFFAKISK